MNKKVMLVILDGWGIATNPKVSAIDQAKTPFVDSLYPTYSHSKLEASGLAVGLPDGQMGNSEVGHMNIGAGRVVYQDLVKVNEAIKDGSLAQNYVLTEALQFAKKENKKLHLIGLVSDGGVHSHIDHIKGLLSIAHSHGLSEVFVHAFTDGRDTDPKGGIGYIQDLEKHMAKTTGKVASLIGRYYAMDRDNRWERVKLAYDLLVHGKGETFDSAEKALAHSYANNVTDEFVQPALVRGQSVTISEGDVVICFNFRTDRGREITQALTQKDFPEQEMKPLALRYITLTNYDDTFKNVEVIFSKDNLENTLGEVISKAGKKQIRIAETEKYPHVTFFFSGGRETVFEGEKRLLCPSPKVATYDLQPEMSAYDIRDAIIPELQSREPDFICLNFANPDMVGHTGVFEAAVKACETVDACAQAIVEVALANDYTTIIIADHGNSDCMINPDGTPNTAHTTNLVPCILVDKTLRPSMKNGKLADLAPTILKLMGVSKPAEMSGQELF
ncbi:2,3-bisphosphoglycerate-independent phosphoglycerate mutase [Cytophagales bacterium LB-30]|uniref:2,3-bisphosphoglycerate-independent phosphoglycerate mutase n=1 Tax=Shiella aurantiaca TaxID=3058365 RepID=A0ABT8F8R3_9BACT|nr:2,3-bisphosphoglycerate-independent phosphoglycerate mutase [Shiella aurantiaca]MDN4166775.1 2,3-bisphosphoglycerate-independent phosphoglycerate mutase [Shiella aurantiaca]